MSGRHQKKPPEGFSERLREAILKCGLSPYEIEKRYGINHSNLNAYMLGEMAPTVPKLATLCEVCKVSADWLLFGKK
jgi:transcriptional regulator with XRE-family HTH domain